MHPPQRSSLFVPILPVPETEAETEGQSSEGPPLMSLCPNPHFTGEEPEAQGHIVSQDQKPRGLAS